ncbi:hypothetical protein [Methylobacterium sp.]|uniref:hypothetical protein n=1 Tax=Methylobacterium sp. TaxID=409 RepID=UPI0025801586|nr:hypothetical protein [Methylobacterium sp.]
MRVILILMVVAWLPALPFAAGAALTSLTGCQVNEANTYPCPVAGHDIGELLYGLMMTGWVLIAFLPFMALTLLLAAVQGLLMLVGAWRRRGETRHETHDRPRHDLRGG